MSKIWLDNIENKLKTKLGRNISPAYGYLALAILPLAFVGVVGYRYITDTTPHREQMYQDKIRECGQPPYIVPLKFQIFPQDWDNASGPNDKDYNEKLNASLVPHTYYELHCKPPAHFFMNNRNS